MQISFVKHEPSNVGLIYRPSNSSFTLNYLLFEITSSTEPSLKKGNSREGGKREKEETTKGELVIIFNATIPLDKSCIHVELTRLQDKILLLCDDESVMLFNIEQVSFPTLNTVVQNLYMGLLSLECPLLASLLIACVLPCVESFGRNFRHLQSIRCGFPLRFCLQ